MNVMLRYFSLLKIRKVITFSYKINAFYNKKMKTVAILFLGLLVTLYAQNCYLMEVTHPLSSIENNSVTISELL